MIKIIKSNEEVFNIFNNELLKNNFSIKFISEIFSISQGTIKRWILLKRIPLNYFNDINKLLNYKYELIQNEKEKFKNMNQFFTNPIEAKRLINETIFFIKNNYLININGYSFIEPAAGSGAFYNNIPKKYIKIGLDIDPKNKKITKIDYFDYKPKNKKNIVIGNPPFGLRGNLALRFINHAANHADFICFILPPLFNSNGKGSPMLRVNKNFSLVKEIKIENNKFNYPNNENIEVNSIFQIWTKLVSENVKPISPPKKVSEWVKIYSLSNGTTSSSKRNVKMIGKCDFYLPSTTFQEVKLFESFNKLPHNRGYGIVILKDKNKIEKTINSINWDNVAFKSTNNAKNLRTNLIIQSIEAIV